MSKVRSITLNNDVEMPQLGFGVWQLSDEEAFTAVGHAFEAGYRSIDTATAYGNEEGTGKALAASGIAREELFVTTKLWNSEQDYDSALRAFDESLAELGLEYVDLYLIHWPLTRASGEASLVKVRPARSPGVVTRDGVAANDASAG